VDDSGDAIDLGAAIERARSRRVDRPDTRSLKEALAVSVDRFLTAMRAAGDPGQQLVDVPGLGWRAAWIINPPQQESVGSTLQNKGGHGLLPNGSWIDGHKWSHPLVLEGNSDLVDSLRDEVNRAINGLARVLVEHSADAIVAERTAVGVGLDRDRPPSLGNRLRQADAERRTAQQRAADGLAAIESPAERLLLTLATFAVVKEERGPELGPITAVGFGSGHAVVYRFSEDTRWDLIDQVVPGAFDDGEFAGHPPAHEIASWFAAAARAAGVPTKEVPLRESSIGSFVRRKFWRSRSGPGWGLWDFNAGSGPRSRLVTIGADGNAHRLHDGLTIVHLWQMTRVLGLRSFAQ